MIFLNSTLLWKLKPLTYLLHIFVLEECLWEFQKCNTHQDVEGSELLTLGDTWNLTFKLKYTFLLQCSTFVRLVCIYGFKAGILWGFRHKLKPYSVSFNKGPCFFFNFWLSLGKTTLCWEVTHFDLSQHFSGHSQLPFKRISQQNYMNTVPPRWMHCLEQQNIDFPLCSFHLI